ncbi:c-type cytochrome [Pseudomonas sp. ABC1]|uniref:c-type cytochrome n=1 Tax=Pseudomonas sp. ABC1 TaxID=2748080 RepID=UPI0015C3D9D2|nr:c-type cytochrome [Pseudomonas sp. ABC1]QLF93975.1 c-type cytochrome [Pseudomonas sp. ABC1]
MLAWLALLVPCASLAAEPGAELFEPCQVCHSLQAGQHGIGPSLQGVVGRQAGQASGFRYSNALLGNQRVWSREALAEFLYDPQASLPGNRMAFSGMDDAAQIEALIDWLSRH